MRLKSLKLAGFKSFANVTTFTFDHNITAIVGPNGCGKSNIIDAIRWVLGETSAKQLRGGAMSDVIFAGTQSKSAKSVASVELTFEHTQDESGGIRHALNLYHELSVRRQVNLDGRSDYFINGTRARRRDVVDIFLGTGLGARSYAVIEQGMIGRIVDSTPMQLREFIEEAAGVSRYQARREETQKKLENTRDNLARLTDMQSEMTRQQKRLTKQAASAREYQTLSEQLTDTQQQLAIYQLYQAKDEQLKQKSAHQKSADHAASQQQEYERLKAKQDKLSTQITQEQWLKDEAQNAHYQQQLNHQKAEQQWQTLNNTCAQIEQQIDHSEQQRQQLSGDIDKLQADISAQQSQLATQQPQLERLESARQQQQKNEQRITRAYYQAQNELSRIQERRRDIEQQRTINEQALQRHQASCDKWARRYDQWQRLWDQLHALDDKDQLNGQSNSQTNSQANGQTNNQKNDQASPQKNTLISETAAPPQSDKITALKTQLQQLERQQESITEHIEEAEPQARALTQQLTTHQQTLSDLEKRGAALDSEYETLHQILHPKQRPSSQDSGADASKATTDAMSALFATLREHIELSDQGQAHAPLLDHWLAPWLSSHVLQANSGTDAQDKTTGSVLDLGHYTTSNSGHSLWLPVKNKTEDTFINNLPQMLKEKVVPLSALIAKPQLALWQQLYVYIGDRLENENLNILWQSLPTGASLLTRDGWLIQHSGALNIGRFLQHHSNAQDSDTQNSDAQNRDVKNAINDQFLTQRLAQRSRLQALEDLLNDNETSVAAQQRLIKQTQHDLDTKTVSLDELRAQAMSITQATHRTQQALARARSDFERWQADTERLASERDELNAERLELDDEQQALMQTAAKIDADLEAVIPQIKAATDNYEQQQAARNEWRRARLADEKAWQALQLSIQKIQLQIEHSINSLTRAQAQTDRLINEEQILSAQLLSDQDKLPALQSALQQAARDRDIKQAQLSEYDDRLKALKDSHQTQQDMLDNIQNELQAAQTARATHATALALSEARLDDAIARVQALFDEAYVSNLLTDFITHQRRVRLDKIDELQKTAAHLEQKIKAIGAVNLAAVAELDDLNARLAPLEQQTADIKASMDTLIDAIAAIDETTKSLFMQTLDAVNDDLARLFAKVFGGGQASLTLNLDELPTGTPKDDHWRAGLTLMAQPKGKRNSRLAVLSGGEKTLTALSLIFAIFKQHPAPFCVLDEVDAPLDDANVARFTSLITELASDVQFIFISHNKLAMQIADELKGITMPTAGISTLVSVSLDEAQRYLDH